MLRIARDKHQAAQVTLSCFNDNVAGLLLYPKLGFVPFAIEERRNKQSRSWLASETPPFAGQPAPTGNAAAYSTECSPSQLNRPHRTIQPDGELC